MKKNDIRIAALVRFAAAITVLNIAGHLYLGFEQSYAHAFVALITGYSLELLIEIVKARTEGRKPAFWGGLSTFIYFLAGIVLNVYFLFLPLGKIRLF